MRGFGWITFKENVAIALAVAELLGVARADGAAGHVRRAAGPGRALRGAVPHAAGQAGLRFANVFAANDPESTLMNVNQLLEHRRRSAARSTS